MSLNPMSRSRGSVIDEPYRLANGRYSCRYRYFDHRGKRVSRTAKGNTGREARDAAQRECRLAVEQTEARLRGERVGPQPIFREVADDALLTTIPARQKPKQAATTKSYLENWWYPRVGDKPIDTITSADCNGVISDARKKVKDSTCNRIMSAGAVIFHHAKAAEMIERLPTTGAVRMREGRKIPIIYSAPELLAITEKLDEEWRPFVALLSLAGLRKTEAMEIRRGDIDLDNGQIVVRCGDGGTKSGHDRIVPIISTYLHTNLEAAVRRAKGKRSKLIDQVDPRKAITRAAKAADVDKRVSPHRLRHGFASLVHAGGLKQRGPSIRTVQAWLGHSTLSVTERYTHLARPTAAGDQLFDRLGQVVGRWGM